MPCWGIWVRVKQTAARTQEQLCSKGHKQTCSGTQRCLYIRCLYYKTPRDYKIPRSIRSRTQTRALNVNRNNAIHGGGGGEGGGRQVGGKPCNEQLMKHFHHPIIFILVHPCDYWTTHSERAINNIFMPALCSVIERHKKTGNPAISGHPNSIFRHLQVYSLLTLFFFCSTFVNRYEHIMLSDS